MLVTLVAGARPNFVKIAPVIRAIREHASGRIRYRLVHTGQHYDKNMSGSFFEELEIPLPDANLECGGGTQAQLTANIMVRFETELLQNKPDLVMVFGDVTSTMACAITAKKLCIPVAHVEAGIRSGDLSMPEEVNRIVTDSISDLFFTTTPEAGALLNAAGIDDARIHLVGNTMIDSLLYNLSRLKTPAIWNEHALQKQGYFILTLHRPNNVDDAEHLNAVLDTVMLHTKPYPVVFPIHPRTKKSLDILSYEHERLIPADPMPYLEFMFLVKQAKGVITDSGGISEETTVLDIPCLTMRNSTERPETVSIGTNILAGTNPEHLVPHLQLLMEGRWKKGSVPNFWDGQTSQRIVKTLLKMSDAISQ